MTTNIKKTTPTTATALVIAARYRKSCGNPQALSTGVVIIHTQNQVSSAVGWANELRNPEAWEPGCIAVTIENDIYIATGGDNYNGAERWELIYREQEVTEVTDLAAEEILEIITKPKTTPRIGEYWPATGGIYAGVIRYPNGEQYHLTLLDIEIAAIEWGKYGTEINGANSHHDGLANTAALRMAGSAIAAALDAAITDTEDAYIPAIRELNIITANIGDDLPQKWHWSSTQYSAGYAWGQGFSGGSQSIGNKCRKLAARAVRRTLII